MRPVEPCNVYLIIKKEKRKKYRTRYHAIIKMLKNPQHPSLKIWWFVFITKETEVTNSYFLLGTHCQLPYLGITWQPSAWTWLVAGCCDSLLYCCSPMACSLRLHPACPTATLHVEVTLGHTLCWSMETSLGQFIISTKWGY